MAGSSSKFALSHPLVFPTVYTWFCKIPEKCGISRGGLVSLLLLVVCVWSKKDLSNDLVLFSHFWNMYQHFGWNIPDQRINLTKVVYCNIWKVLKFLTTTFTQIKYEKKTLGGGVLYAFTNPSIKWDFNIYSSRLVIMLYLFIDKHNSKLSLLVLVWVNNVRYLEAPQYFQGVPSLPSKYIQLKYK